MVRRCGIGRHWAGYGAARAQVLLEHAVASAQARTIKLVELRAAALQVPLLWNRKEPKRARQLLAMAYERVNESGGCQPLQQAALVLLKPVPKSIPNPTPGADQCPWKAP